MSDATSSQHSSKPNFFKAGGTLKPNTPSYVIRPADDELYESILAGHFCYVLTTRQMGKSSLMVRTASRLQEVGVSTAIIDLSTIGTEATAEQWYLGLLTTLKAQLSLKADPGKYWQKHESIPPSQRFSDFLKDVVLAEISTKVAIFIDEIDYTLGLEFSDDFFAAVRAVYNARASEPVYDRLVFILLGVATPTDLIKDRRRTPFNIGKHIDLREFQQDKIDLEPTLRQYQAALEEMYPGQGKFIFKRVFHWTNGHPYLTQKLCQEIADLEFYKRDKWTEKDIDNLVSSLFLSEKARGDVNIQAVSDKTLNHAQKIALLKLYKRIFQGETVPDDKQSSIHNQLKLTGLVISDEQGNLLVSNRIYSVIFDLDWINRHATQALPTYLIPAASVAAVVIIILIVFFVIRSQNNLEPTPTTAAVIIDNNTPTKTVDETQTATAQPTETLPPTNNPTESPATAETLAPTATDTVAPTETATPLPEPTSSNLVRANITAGIFPAPSESFSELALILEGDSVEILNRAAREGWMFVQNSAGEQGFAATSLFNLPINFDLSALPVMPTPRIAFVVTSVSIMPTPNYVQENEIGFISAGDIVAVLGRQSGDTINWLYIRTADGTEGFAIISGGDGTQYLEWPGSPEELQTLDVRN